MVQNKHIFNFSTDKYNTYSDITQSDLGLQFVAFTLKKHSQRPQIIHQ